MSESSDVTLVCNIMENNRLGLDFSRSSLVAGGKVAFRQNRFTSGAGLGLVATDHANYLKLGGLNTFVRGKNIFDLTDPATQFFVEQSGTPAAEVLDARKCFWKFDGVLQTDLATILAEFEGGDAGVNLTALTSGEPACVGGGQGQQRQLD